MVRTGSLFCSNLGRKNQLQPLGFENPSFSAPFASNHFGGRSGLFGLGDLDSLGSHCSSSLRFFLCVYHMKLLTTTSDVENYGSPFAQGMSLPWVM